MKKIPFYFMYATWIFYILFFTSFLAPWRVPTVITFAAAFLCTIAWSVSERITKTSTKKEGFATMGNSIADQVSKITKSEYFALKKSQKKTRIIGAVLFVVGLILYPVFISLEMPFLVMPAGICEVTGLIMFIISFTHQKYAVLKHVKFEKETNTSPISKPNPGIPASISPVPSNGQGGVGKPVETSSKINKVENNRILGCLIGGAAGDALGYAVEFVKYDSIIKKYGKGGITSYSLDQMTVKALISDDTQMTLFTAEGLLEQEGDEIQNIYHSYKNWLITQNTSFENRPFNNTSELMNCSELFSPRAPGNTCLSALTFNTMGTVKNPINSSKGCGGVMRVSPIAFLNYYSPFELDKLAAQAAAITHGHPLGYLPAALLVHIIHKSIYENGTNRSLLDIVNESMTEFTQMFSTAPYFNDLIALINKAIDYSGNNRKDIDNIRDLGEGWVAEETLAIAIYSALRHHDDFSAALVASVNHDGDSDSTGAVTGNILGAYLGDVGIDDKWKEHLELYDLISKIAAEFSS